MAADPAQALFEAITKGEVDRVRAALAATPALASARGADGTSAVRHALYHRRGEVARALLESRPTLDVFDAAATGDEARLKELIAEDPAVVSAFAGDGFTPLHLAAFFGHLGAARLLVQHGADVKAEAANASRVQPLHSAVAAQHPGIAALLLQHKAPRDPRQAGGYTPLHAAAKAGDLETLGLLLDMGADPDAETDDGQTARDLADGDRRTLLLLDMA
jgi:ankyrin repeat protein